MKNSVLLDPGIEMAGRLRLACEAHDSGIGTHLDHVAYYASELGRMIGLSSERINELLCAAPLHDIGKIGLPVALLEKGGSLTDAELEIIKTHTTIGHRILDGSDWPVIRCAANIALSHHENWDGTGYPHGIRGDEIPLEARIVAVADVYDALLSRRSYKPAWDRSLVIAEMERLRGRKFDPELLDCFFANLAQLEAPLA